MKKKMILLALVLIISLSLCACGNLLDEDQMAMVCGTWRVGNYQQEGEAPGYFELKEDGTGSFNGQDGLSWSGIPSREDEFLLTITIKTEDKDRYTLEMYTADPNNVDAWLIMDEEGPSYIYRKTSRDVQNPWFADLQTQWQPYDEDAAVKSIFLNADGTVQIGEKTYFWSNSADWQYDENHIYLDLYDAQGMYGTIQCAIRENGLYEFYFYDEVNGGGGGYYDHPMLKILEYGSWESFDRFTMVEDYFSVGPWSGMSYIQNTEYRVRFDTKTDEDILSVEFLEGDAVRYVAKIGMNGDYPTATLTDRQSGDQTLYFNNYYGYAQDDPDALYYKTINLVYRYANDHSIYTLETDEYVDQEDRLPYIYQKLMELNGYKQAQEFVDRFTIVPGMLTEVKQYNTDRLNNVSENRLSAYGYDKTGTMIWARGEAAVELYGVYDTDPQRFTYADGKIAEVEVGYTDSIDALATPVFDEDGKLVRMDVQERSREYSTVFTYDDQGRLIRIEIPDADYGDPRIYEYTYDDSGRLLTKVKSLWEGRYIYTDNYIYEGDICTEIHQVIKQWDEECNRNYIFTNDDQGRPLSAQITTDDPDVTYKSQQLEYIYEDLYFFDSTGLVLEDD